MLVRAIRYILLLVCLIGVRMHVDAQLEVWRHIDIREMANTNILCMAEDTNGLLYLGTHDGVSVFDGRRFMSLVFPGKKEQGINPFVNSMKWDWRGVLWIATRTHVITYDPRNGDTRVLFGRPSVIDINNVELDTLNKLAYILQIDTLGAYRVTDSGLSPVRKWPSQGMIDIVLSNTGELYATISDTAISKMERGTLRKIYSSSYVSYLKYLPKQDALIMITDTGLVSISLQSGAIDTLRVKEQWKHHHGKTKLTILSDGRLCVHHENGFFLLDDLQDTTATSYNHDEKNPASIMGDFISCAFADKRKNLWVAEDGITLSVQSANGAHVHYISPKMTGASRLWRSYHDTARKQVFSSSEKGMCAYYYRDKKSYLPGIMPPNQKFFEVLAFVPWAKDELLLLTNGQGSWLFNMASYKFRPFDTLNRYFQLKNFWGLVQPSANDNIIYRASPGVYWYRRKEGTITPMNGSRILDTGRTAIASRQTGYLIAKMDTKKRIWFGAGYGVDVFDSNLNFVKGYGGKKKGGNEGLTNTVVLDIAQAGDGDMYVATMGGGVHHLTAADTFETVPLVGDIGSTYCIAAVDKQHIIITTSKGMCLYNTVSRQSKMINEQYGMPVTDFNQYALGVDDKFVVAAGANGVAIIERDKLMQCFYDTARLLVMQGAQPVTGFTLEKGKKLLDFDLAITGYLGNADWKIRYKLDGLDDDWREMAKGEWHIRYNSIKPGDYTLRVEAIDGQNVIWAAPASVHFTALPYFWQTLWFKVLAVLLAIAVLVVTVRFLSQVRLKWKLKKLEDEQKISRERIRISRELHDNVGSQLTYLITGLESSQMLLNKNEKEVLEKKIEKMQSSARESMQQLRDSIWALNSETVAASVLVSRFGKWMENIMEAFPDTQYVLHSEINTDVGLDPIRSLNLFRIMQEAVHNVLKHAQATVLTVNYICSDNALNITIEDNGKGFDAKQAKGNGTRTMADRAEEMGAAFSLVSVVGEGTKISLVIPF